MCGVPAGAVKPVTVCLHAVFIMVLTGLLQSPLCSEKWYYGKHVSDLRNITYASVSISRKISFFLNFECILECKKVGDLRYHHQKSIWNKETLLVSLMTVSALQA